MGQHDMRCSFAYKIGRHNVVQRALHRQLLDAQLASHRATVHELRADANYRSQKQADLVVQGIGGTMTETLVDVGVTHPSFGTMNSYQPWKSRAAAANTYALAKDNRYRGLLAVAQALAAPQLPPPVVRSVR